MDLLEEPASLPAKSSPPPASSPPETGNTLPKNTTTDAGAALDRPDGLPRADAVPEGSAGPSDAGAALPQPEAQPIDDNPAFLRATVNQVDVGDVLVILRGNDLIMKVADLERGGMRVEGGKREKHDEDVLVSLRSLAPKVNFVFDERSLTLTITADSTLFGSVAFDLRAKRPEGIIYGSAPSLFVNYQAGVNEIQDGSHGAGSARWNGFAESGLSVRGHLLYASGQRSAIDGSWERLMTNLTLDLRDRLTSIVFGDVNATSDPLGGAALLGGMSVVRNFGLDPYFVFLPTQQVSGTALTPSTVDVYVNGQLVRREALPPGQFTMQNLPVTSGSGQTQIVIRDALGAIQSVVSPYYLALGTLAKGLQDYSYNVGFMRQNYGVRGSSWDYGPPAFLFRHRLGLTNWLTVGARAEGNLHMLSGGLSLSLRLPVGELGAGGAASGQDGLAGAAAIMSYSYVGRILNFQVGARYQNKEYTTLNLAPFSMMSVNSSPSAVLSPAHRQRWDLLGSVARNIGKVANVSLQDEATEWLDQGWTNRITLSVNRTITRWMYAFATVGEIYSRILPVEYDTFVGLSFAPAESVTAGVSRSDHRGGAGSGGATQATLQQSLPLGTGLGYRVVASQGQNTVNEADAQYQGAYGRLEADYQHVGWGANAGHASLTGSGGIVLIGGDVFLTRQVQDGYALIKVPGLPGVHGTISNQIVGTTNKKGNLLIPNLLSSYGNRIGIDDKDVPLEYNIKSTELTIAPPHRGGVVVSFPVRRVQSVSGTVLVEERGTAMIPSYGQLIVHVEDKPVYSPLDEAGNFYLENVPPGSYSAEVQYATGSCMFPMEVVAGAAALVDVGTVRCIVPGKESK